MENVDIYQNIKKVNQLYQDNFEEYLTIFNEIKKDNIYERLFQIEKDDIVVDIGAHVGVFVEKALSQGAAKVYAVEPSKENFSLLQFRYKDNPKVELINAAIFKDDLGAYFDKKGTIGAIGDLNFNSTDAVMINTIDFRTFYYKEDYIDFLKLDCEGGEYYILNTEQIQVVLKNVQKIAAELHLFSIETKRKFLKTFDLLKKYKFPFVIYSVDGLDITDTVCDNIFSYTEVLLYCINPRVRPEKISLHHCKGSFLEINSPFKNKYYVNFFKHNEKNNKLEIHYETILNNNNNSKILKKYFLPLNVSVSEISSETLLYCEYFNLFNKRVVIDIRSRPLGDTLAWLPYVDEFQKKHKCELFVTTFHNHLFEGQYPNLNFLPLNSEIKNVFAWYEITWFFNGDEVDYEYHPNDMRKQPMQKTASDILGLEYKEIKPKINFIPKERPIEKEYICIANHSTSQAKYWNNIKGWDLLVEKLKQFGYEVVLLSKEPDGFNGNKNPIGVLNPTSYDLQTTMNYIHHSKLFIGISSGLSWLSWALNKKVVLISGFTDSFFEMQSDVIRIGAPKGKCSGCLHKVRIQNDNDWNWCPEHKGTERRFECSKSITVEQVFEKIKEEIK